MPVHPSLNRPPQARARPAAAQPYSLYRHIHARKQRKAVTQRVRHALHNCPRQMPRAHAPPSAPQTLPAHASPGVASARPAGTASTAARRSRPAPARPRLSARHSCHPGSSRSRSQRRAQPRGLRHAHHVPAPRHRMAKRMQAPTGVERRFRRSPQTPRQRVPIVTDTAPGSRMPIPTAPAPWSPAPATTRRALPSARSRASGSIRNLRAHLRRLPQLRQPLFLHPRRADHLTGPPTVRHIQQQRAGGLLHVHRIGPCQPVAHIVLGTQHMRDPGINLRLVARAPTAAWSR